ncbi:MAG: 2Fe-2S iron-sulfur cluster-binding protein, partial [Pseudomonadota bacterium]
MTARLAEGGRLINRARPLGFRFDGHWVQAFEGDTLASALLGAGHLVQGRSFKYHRPRGPVTCGPEEPNALMAVGRGGRFEPNQRATEQAVFPGLEARSQNAWPSLGFDVGRINDFGARFLPAGFYYKTFIHPRPLWKHLFEPFIRRAAGLGPAPTEADADRYEFQYAFCDLLVVGGGIAGLSAALIASQDGKRVILVERSAHWGGRACVDGAIIDDRPADIWVKDAVQRLEAMDNVTLLTRCEGAGVYDHGYVLCDENLTGHLEDKSGVRQRLWRIRAGHVVTATGAIERPLSFAGNDVPGVMLASALRDYAVNYGVAVGQRVVLVTNNDDAYRTALALLDRGLTVAAVLDARAECTSPLINKVKDLGVDVHFERGIRKVHGNQRVTGVSVCRPDGVGLELARIDCDCVGMSGGWSPVVHLWSHCGGKLIWDGQAAMFRPDPDQPPKDAAGQGFVTAVGSAAGAMSTADVLASVAAAMGGPVPGCEAEGAAPLTPIWIMPAKAGPQLRMKMWLDYQNDVKVSDVQLAAREGFESVEHAKRYTTLGMATDQGKLSNINGLAVLADQIGAPIPQVGTTTFRPPYTPLTLAALAGEAKGDLFQPVRQTPLHAWHEGQGAYMEPVGQWRRPYCYPRKG